MASFKINIKLKIHISRALEFMVSTDKSKILRGAFEPNLINLLLETENQGDESVNFELLVFLGQILMINPGFTEEVLRFISKTFIGFAKLTIRVQSLLDQTLLTQNAELIGKLYNIHLMKIIFG